MTPSDEFAARVAAALRSGELPVPDALLGSIAARTAQVRQQRHPQMLSLARIVLEGGAALAVAWFAITMLQTTGVSTGPFDSVARDDFTLSLAVPRDTYRVGEAIEPVATLTYRGPQDEVQISTAFQGPLYFGAERDGGPRVTPGWRDSCERVSMARGVALERAFGKSGGFGRSSPDSDFIEWYLKGGKPLTLTPGTWHLYVIGHFNEGGCAAGPEQQPDMRATVTVVVEDGPLSATFASGEYALTLSVPRTVYRAGEAVDATAEITFSGSGQQGIWAGRTGIVGFGSAPGHGHAVTPPFVRSGRCAIYRTLRAGEPLAIPFHLASDDFSSAPAGLWEIVAVTDFAPNSECSGRVKLRAVIAIEIRP